MKIKIKKNVIIRESVENIKKMLGEKYGMVGCEVNKEGIIECFLNVGYVSFEDVKADIAQATNQYKAFTIMRMMSLKTIGCTAIKIAINKGKFFFGSHLKDAA